MEAYVHNPTPLFSCNIRLKNLEMHRKQRDVNMTWVGKLYEQFRASGVQKEKYPLWLCVVNEDEEFEELKKKGQELGVLEMQEAFVVGKYYVLDGQHRIEAYQRFLADSRANRPVKKEDMAKVWDHEDAYWPAKVVSKEFAENEAFHRWMVYANESQERQGVDMPTLVRALVSFYPELKDETIHRTREQNEDRARYDAFIAKAASSKHQASVVKQFIHFPRMIYACHCVQPYLRLTHDIGIELYRLLSSWDSMYWMLEEMFLFAAAQFLIILEECKLEGNHNARRTIGSWTGTKEATMAGLKALQVEVDWDALWDKITHHLDASLPVTRVLKGEVNPWRYMLITGKWIKDVGLYICKAIDVAAWAVYSYLTEDGRIRVASRPGCHGRLNKHGLPDILPMADSWLLTFTEIFTDTEKAYDFLRVIAGFKPTQKKKVEKTWETLSKSGEAVKADLEIALECLRQDPTTYRAIYAFLETNWTTHTFPQWIEEPPQQQPDQQRSPVPEPPPESKKERQAKLAEKAKKDLEEKQRKEKEEEARKAAAMLKKQEDKRKREAAKEEKAKQREKERKAEEARKAAAATAATTAAETTDEIGLEENAGEDEKVKRMLQSSQRTQEEMAKDEEKKAEGLANLFRSITAGHVHIQSEIDEMEAAVRASVPLTALYLKYGDIRVSLENAWCGWNCSKPKVELELYDCLQ